VSVLSGILNVLCNKYSFPPRDVCTTHKCAFSTDYTTNMASSHPVCTTRPSGRLADKNNIADSELESHRIIRLAQARPSTSSASSPELSLLEPSGAVCATLVPESTLGTWLSGPLHGMALRVFS